MFNVCFQCGEYRPDKIIDPAGPFAICPVCNYKHPFLQLPLLTVGGASGTGKTTICQTLIGKLPEVVILEGDILWRPEFNKPEGKYLSFFETWLRICKNISQSGRPVVMFNAGMGVPENLESCIERRYFSNIRYLALTCEDETLAGRLRSRPVWRGCSDLKYVEAQIMFNRWFLENGSRKNPRINILDTTNIPSEKTAEKVADWIRSNL